VKSRIAQAVAKLTAQPSRGAAARSSKWPNTLLNRTRNGVPRLGLISFWPRRVTPLRAG